MATNPRNGDRPSLGLGSIGGLPAPVSRRGQVLEVLRDAIVSGDIAPGERLKQDEICARFQVSPAPVREALRDLESEGLVRHRPNHGVVVLEMTDDELLGVLVPVRLAVETWAWPRAAQLLDEEARTELEEIIAAMGDAADAGDVKSLNRLDARFHVVVIAASGSEHALQLWDAVLPRIRLQFGRLAPRHRDLHEIQQEHRELLDALLTQNAGTIRDALRVHIADSAAELVRAGTSVT